MSKRRRGFFRGRRSFSVNAKRPISVRTKTTYALAGCSLAVFAAAMYYAVYTDGDSGKIVGGVGVVFLVMELLAMISSVAHIKNDIEPLPARVLAIFASLLALAAWGGLYVLGMARG